MPTSINLAELNGNNGFVLKGNRYDQTGYSVSNAGDVNGDGFDDVIIGAADAPRGASYVVFGGSSLTPSLELDNLDGTNGFILQGVIFGDDAGWSVSSAGDVNGDGLDDVIIGAPFANRDLSLDVGKTYVLFGNDSFAPSLRLSSLDGNNGFVFQGTDAGDVAGLSVSDAGDVNGDGFDDFLIGAQGGDPNGDRDAGETYIIFGGNSFAPTARLDSLDGSNGFVINGINANDLSGTSISGAGDVNGDGLDDVIINGSYVVFGRNSFASSLDLDSLDGTNGFTIEGSGRSVSDAGDVNGDGFDDVIIGAPNVDVIIRSWESDAGESYVVFGRSSFAPSLDLDNLDGTNGFTLSGIYRGDRSGTSVSSAGDFNGDGFDDILIGAPDADLNRNTKAAGESYLVFGGNDFDSTLELNRLNGSNGFAITGIAAQNYTGRSVSGAGDVNRDGLADIIIGAAGGFNGGGDSYVLFGSQSINTIERVINGTSGRDNIRGQANPEIINALAGNDSVVGLAGSDTINGDAGQDSLFGNDGSDVITGGDGNDLILGQAGDDWLQGNNGQDKIYANNGNDQLFGGNGMDTLFGGAGQDSMLGGEDNDILRGQAGADTLFGETGQDSLLGNNGNDILTGGNGTDSLFGNAGDDVLAGDAGNDILFGNNDHDSLFGGQGNDTLWGGSGNDVFELSPGVNMGVDRVKDYLDGADKFKLGDRFGFGSLEFSELNIAQNGNNAVISIARNNQVLAIVENVNAGQLNDNDFIVE
ncbi:putative calcium-binding protein,FG-GAP repeat protein [Xenococcus sp. PCC 7305]|uniref:FG-GAP repeat protein n=1 Tax=Xenococcus sp. PCC 7305 TaxID=102125 RepID=UPI0002AC8945|nr:FG-GAP repeat protein [Xenococcus sp. PCC 7305]ELS05319.1 putative calcium-binding protein,FG-GAP repeat protein [Xenococcus sp. PCC 7305]